MFSCHSTTSYLLVCLITALILLLLQNVPGLPPLLTLEVRRTKMNLSAMGDPVNNCPPHLNHPWIQTQRMCLPYIKLTYFFLCATHTSQQHHHATLIVTVSEPQHVLLYPHIWPSLQVWLAVFVREDSHSPFSAWHGSCSVLQYAHQHTHTHSHSSISPHGHETWIQSRLCAANCSKTPRAHHCTDHCLNNTRHPKVFFKGEQKYTVIPKQSSPAYIRRSSQRLLITGINVCSPGCWSRGQSVLFKGNVIGPEQGALGKGDFEVIKER